MLLLERSVARFEAVGWVLDYLDDLESDLSVLHRVDDMWSMPGPRFLRLAMRTVAYPGVMQARAQGLLDARPEQPVARAETRGVVETRLPNGDVVREIPPDQIASSPLAGLIEMS